MTMTNEPFQPVRLYYAVPDKSFVEKKLKKLECMVEAPHERCWQWLFHGEAASLRFSKGGYDDVPKERRPIVLGRIRFPKQRSMTFETNSTERAIAGARFFASRLGTGVVAMRCRLVNRYFAAEEGQLPKLMATLDHNVTVIDPRETEAALKREFEVLQPNQDPERIASEFIENKIKSKEDVPMVEDFPLIPEEETPDFRNLMMFLEFRRYRALEHWNGNTHLTLPAIIVRMVEESRRRGNQQ
jgi:hypothetical protein